MDRTTANLDRGATALAMSWISYQHSPRRRQPCSGAVAPNRLRTLISGDLHGHNAANIWVIPLAFFERLEVRRQEHESELQRPQIIDRAVRPLIDGRRSDSESTGERSSIAIEGSNGFFLGNPGHVHGPNISTLLRIVQARLFVHRISWLT